MYLRQGTAVYGLLLLGLTACDIEPPSFVTDAGTAADAGVDDAGVDDAGTPDSGVFACDEADPTCPAGYRCDTMAAQCILECAATAECADGEVCLFEGVPTATTAVSTCAPHPAACDSDDDCSGGRCLAVGVCGPAATAATVVDRTLQPAFTCTVGADCGPAGVCRDGVCSTCRVNSDCSGGLLCIDGACEQALRCGTNDECFAGNICETQRCRRDTSACAADGGDDDQRSTATAIAAVSLQGLSICGEDDDWYQLVVPESHGVEVVLTHAASAGITVDLEDEDGGRPVGLTRIDGPGITVLRAPLGPARKVFLHAYSTDVSGDYDLHVRLINALCTTDPVEIYGGSLTVPTNVAFEGTVCPLQDEHFDFTIAAGDAVAATMTMIAPATEAAGPEVDVLDDTGASLVVAPGADVQTQPVAGGGALSLEARVEFASALGDPYRMSLVRRLAGRESACTAPPVLDPTAGPVLVQGNLSTGTDLGRPDCSGLADTADFAAAERADLLYGLAGRTRDVLLRAWVRTATGSGSQASVALLSSCADDGSAQACDTAPFVGRAAAIEAVLAPSDNPVLVVSSDGESTDVPFELEVEIISLDPADIGNDTCEGAIALDGASPRVDTVVLYGGAREDGTPFGAQNDDVLLDDEGTTAVCRGFADQGLGVDRYYRLSLGANERAAVELSGPLGGMLWTSPTTSCGDLPGTCAQAQVRTFSDPILRATFTASISGQEHVVVVDGQLADDRGTYALRTIRNAQCFEDVDCTGGLLCSDYACVPRVINDVCLSAETVTVGPNGTAEVAGNTGAAQNDYRLSCADTGQPDVVYTVIVPPGTQELVARISDATFDPAIEIRQETCEGGLNARVWCVDDVRLPDVLLPEVRIAEPEAAAGGTPYFIIVGSFAGEGDFTLQVELR